MYHFAFPYVAEFSVQSWPWKENAAIYAVAVNMVTGMGWYGLIEKRTPQS